jgi:hypothetical protein
VVVEPASGWGVEDDIIVVVDVGLLLCNIFAPNASRACQDKTVASDC